MKDMVQNHLLQILSIVAMERPASFKGEDLHEEQLKVLKALRPASGETIRDMLVLGQYEGYREEKGVKPDSATETYAALRLFVDNERWQDVPFYIRTGKKLGRREMEVAVIFRQTEEYGENNVLLIKSSPWRAFTFSSISNAPGNPRKSSRQKWTSAKAASWKTASTLPKPMNAFWAPVCAANAPGSPSGIKSRQAGVM